jgi:gliding motility-associated-like protein
MNIIKFLFLFIMLICQNSFAQKQNNQWRFGYGVAIDFNTVPPSFVNGCPIATGEGSASVADKVTGALLFYTDGVTVWNANNQVMPNGTGLLGGTPALLSSTTAAVIVPKPGSSSLYYIVTIDEQASNNGVRYSVVDMALNGGSGDVIAAQKNILLLNTNSEKLEVVPAADGASFWLITRDNSGDSFYSFRITNAGIQNTPVISTVGSPQGNGAGHMKINRQFNKIAIGVTFGSKMELFDFDHATGVISNPISWNYNLASPLIYGIEFSPDGKVLYITDLNTILQYDLTQTTPLAIQNSVYQVATGGNTSLQLGIDNKIYVNSGSLNAINCPNKLGAACGYQTNVIANQTSGGGYGLPKWVYYPNDTANVTTNAIIYADTCFGNTTQFSIQNTAGISSVSWNFGDPSSGTNNTAVGFTASHIFSQVGNYDVYAVITNACGTDTLFLNALSIFNCTIPPTITGIKLIGDTCAVPTLLSLQAEGISSSPYFFWNFGDPASGVNDTITITGSSSSPFPTHTFSSPGLYNVCVSFQEPGFPVSTVCRRISIGLCCEGIIASNNNCLENNISFSILSIGNISQASWNFDDPSSGANNTSTSLTPNHLFSATGTYNVRCIVTASCGVDTINKSISIVSCNCIQSIPAAFTPNGDGINDRWIINKQNCFRQVDVNVYNRYGSLVFSKKNYENEWNGTYRSKPLPDGTYYYVLNAIGINGSVQNLKGNLTILR